MKSTVMAAVKKIIIKGLEDKTENINILQKVKQIDQEVKIGDKKVIRLSVKVAQYIIRSPQITELRLTGNFHINNTEKCKNAQ